MRVSGTRIDAIRQPSSLALSSRAGLLPRAAIPPVGTATTPPAARTAGSITSSRYGRPAGFAMPIAGENSREAARPHAAVALPQNEEYLGNGVFFRVGNG